MKTNALRDKANIIPGLLIAIGLIGAGYEISNTLYKGKTATNIVTVKGFAERDVKADLALWTISFSIAGDDLAAVYDKSRGNELIISEFLEKEGLKKDDIKIGNVQVIDTSSQYHAKDAVVPLRYSIRNTVSVRSADVDTVDKATHELADLVKQGIILHGNSVNYEFTGLNNIKTEMLHEATQNARHAAEQFANDSGSKVGSIQSANQGFFSIVSRDDHTGAEVGYSAAPGSLDKKVRVVTTVTYYLDK